ncbi:MAG: preprotein translocase subunit SecE [Bacilli bacterium]|nr:preprotein translocase subunit SecE [Bacilli bacterium]
MAVEKKENKENKILTILTKEYKYEGLILLVLSLIAIVLGVLIIVGENTGTSGLVIKDDVFLIGDYPKVFAWILIILGAVSLLLAVWPFYKPSIGEIRKISWPSKGVLLKNSVTVLLFSLAMSLFFLLVDLGLTQVVEFFKWLASKMGIPV